MLQDILIVKKETLPECLEITAMTENKIIMAIQHKKLSDFWCSISS